MSDRDLPPDPMDKAYREAEALLKDDQAQAKRRAAILAAAERTPVEAQPTPSQTSRRLAWRRGGWLAAAGIGGVSLLLASQIYRPVPVHRPAPPPPATVVAPAEPPPPPMASPPAAKAAAPERRTPDAPPPASPTADRAEEPAPKIVEAPPPAPAPAAPAPAARAVARAQASPDAARSAVEELVVTGSRIEPPPRGPSPRLERRLRDAAAADRTRELSALLAQGVPVDAADDKGETALMKAIQAGHPAAVKILRRQGADPDLRNHAGRSARDMAAAAADPDIDRALRLVD